MEKFTRKKLLGAGGMGEVWLAWDGQLGRWVALKFLKGVDKDDIARFQREAQIAAGLTHPHIAAIYEVGTANGQSFIAMQYIEGTTLKKSSRTNRRELVNVMAEAARAVHFAHEKGIVHRDLKPDNFMVTKEGHVFVMDFGLAKPFDSAQGGPAEGAEQFSVSGVIVGTPSFMAPEQARGLPVDERADVYGLGATLYHLITRRKPFDAPSTLETIALVIGEDPRRPRSIDPSIDADLETIILKCMEKDPSRRYPSAEALAADLERHVAGEPISAHAPSAIYRFLKFARRRKAMLGFVAVVGLVAAIGVGFLLPAMKRESTARIRNETALTAEKRRAEALNELASLWTQVLLAREGLYRRSEDPVKVMDGLRRAVREVSAYIGRNPRQAQGYYVRAKGELYLNELSAAEEDLRKALELEPRFTPGHALLGRVLLEQYVAAIPLEGSDFALQKRRVQQVAHLLKAAREELALATAPAGADIEWGLVRTKEDDVAAVLTRVLKAEYLDEANEVAIEMLYKEQAAAPSEEYCNWLGTLLGGLEEKIKWNDRALEIMPHYCKAHCERGSLRLIHGDVKGAIADFEECVRIDPRFVLAWYNLGIARTELKDPDGAIANYTKALEINPNHVSALCNRGSILQQRREFQAAREDYDRALAIDPDDTATLFNRAMVRAVAADFPGAFVDYDRLLGLDPKNSKAYQYRGMTRANMRDHAGAVEDYTKAIEFDPRAAALYVLRATAKRDARDAKGAIEDATKAIEIDPVSVDALSCRGGMYVAVGWIEAAIGDLNRALELDPKLPDAWGNLGMAYQIQKDYAKAAANWQKALEVAPAGWPLRAQVEAWLKALPGN